MSENVGDVTTGAQSDAPENGRRRKRKSFDAARARMRIVGVLSSVIRWLGTLAATLLTVHVVLTIGGANPENGITRFVARWAEPLALGFPGLFQPADPVLQVLVNYGIAAVFWLVVTSLAVRIVQALA